MKEKKLSDAAEIVFESDDRFSDWFGYYNYDPLNHNQTKMLCNRAPKDGIAPERGVEIELGYYEIQTGKWHHIGYSDSWNWQQGAMMQWIPGHGNENKVIYNCSRDGHLVSKIVDIVTRETRILNWPIYGLTPDGKKSITLNLERSYWCRAYHYESVINPAYDCLVPEDDGIFEIDLERNERRRIVSIQSIISKDYCPEFDQMKHWVEHIMVSNDGMRFCFLHRFSPEFNVNLYQTRLFVADIDGENLQIIDNWDKVDWSHFGWNGKDFAIYTVQNNLVASAYKDLGQASTNTLSIKQVIFRLAAKISRLLPASIRRALKGGKAYYQYYQLSDTGKYELSEVFDDPLFNIDGHPSFTNDNRYMITDSYPDDKQYQRLIVYDSETHQGMLLAKFYAYYHKNPASCDLHPKLSRCNDFVVVDSAYNARHHMVMIRLDWDKIKKQISR